MKTKLSFNKKRNISHMKNLLVPKGLFYRFFLIIFIPMFLVQTLGLYIFFDRHLFHINRRLAFAVASEIQIAMQLTEHTDYSHLILDKISEETELEFEYKDNNLFSIEKNDELSKATIQTFNDKFGAIQYRIAQVSKDSFLIEVKNKSGDIIQVTTPYKRLYSSTFHIFVLWNIGLSLLFLFMAVIFMKNQIRPIRKLADVAEAFGRDMSSYKYFKIAGAKEVRQASTSFIKMRDRIKKQIEQRTNMLSGISHDLRTPLTRMKLELAMLEESESHKYLLKDIEEMEEMLKGYIAFAKGENEEVSKEINFNDFIKDIVHSESKHYNKGFIDLHLEQEIQAHIKPNSFRRAMTNIISNGCKYAKNVWVQVGLRGDYIEIRIDDDGKGIPSKDREEVFKPFFRLEKSRNKNTGGVGLGLAVTRDIINSHGGSITLDDSPYGGLKVVIRLPK
ncbi:MAG: ATP-binding protein [Alphaproteobacteria bacterium]|nr:ATP-binding protein [Alphaproteobacteria bacterium]